MLFMHVGIFLFPSLFRQVSQHRGSIMIKKKHKGKDIKMSVQFSYDNNRLTAALKGDIDHHGAAEMRIQIDGELERTMPSLLTLDFSEVGFMDSSGIGLILGRARKASGWNGKVVITSPSDQVRKILRLSGLEGMIKKTEGK